MKLHISYKLHNIPVPIYTHYTDYLAGVFGFSGLNFDSDLFFIVLDGGNLFSQTTFSTQNKHTLHIIQNYIRTVATASNQHVSRPHGLPALSPQQLLRHERLPTEFHYHYALLLLTHTVLTYIVHIAA